MRERALPVLIGVALGLAGVAGCGGKPPGPVEKVSVAIYHFPGSAAFYVAMEKGYFRDEGLDVTFVTYAAGHQALRDALAGKADFATSADTPIVRAALEGMPVAVLATICEIERGVRIIARRDRGISSPGDLRGKKIGMVAGTTTEFFLDVYLALSNIKREEVRAVNLAPDRFNDALLSGEVDAASANAPYNVLLRDRLGKNALSFDDRDIYRMTWNISAAQEFARNNPARATKLLRALLRANRYMEQHPQETRVISARYIGGESPLYEKEWSDYHHTAVLNQSLVLTLEDQARWVIRSRSGDGQKIPNFLELIHADALKAAEPDAVTITGK